MKRGNQSIALVLLGMVALIALVGMLLMLKKTPSGNYYDPYYDKPYVMVNGPLNWDNLLGFAPSLETAESWCPQHTISEGGFLDVLQMTGKGQFRCYVPSPEAIPPEFRPYYKSALEYSPYYSEEIKQYKPNIAPVACFLGSQLVPPEGVALPLICAPPQWAYFPNTMPAR
jgi:hypothetical protein